MRKRTPAERQRVALEQGAGIHPPYTTEFETAFSVSWPRVPWAALRQPHGRVHFAGDYMTYMSSWMQGAFRLGPRGRNEDPPARPRSKPITTPLTM